jgi:hypothetical protein
MTTWRSPRRIAVLVATLIALSIAGPASAGAAKKLGFGVQPVGTTAGLVLNAVTVEILDNQNRVVTDSTAPVTLALSSGGTLYGTLTRNAVAGVATFTGLRVLPAGTYTVTATSPGLTSRTSNAFAITGAGAVCNGNGCVVNDPNGTEPTKTNKTTATISLSSCPGAGTNTDFLSYDESAGNFCEGGCLGSAVFFTSDCDAGDPWLILYRLDKTALPTDKGAPHIVMYIEDANSVVSVIPDCIKQGILNPGPVCVSKQYKNGQGDSVTEILKAPGDPKIAG